MELLFDIIIIIVKFSEIFVFVVVFEAFWFNLPRPYLFDKEALNDLYRFHQILANFCSFFNYSMFSDK